MRQRFSYRKSVALIHVYTPFVGRSFQDPHNVRKPTPFLLLTLREEPNQAKELASPVFWVCFSYKNSSVVSLG